MATKPKKRKPDDGLPNLDNATPSFLADELGAVRKEIKALEKLAAFFKTALKSRIDKKTKEAKGDKFTVVQIDVTQKRLNGALVEEALSKKKFEACHKEITFTQLKVTENTLDG